MQKTQVRNSFLLLLTATIWGISFVAQSVGMDHLGPFTFNGIRTFLGGLVLLPIVLVNARANKKAGGQNFSLRTTVVGGLACGVCLCVASTLQQYGIMYTTVGKAGFITAFYIVLVPIFGIFLRKKTGLNVWLAVVIALVGLYLLCINEAMSVNKGDLLILACSLVLTVHILVIDHFAPKADSVTMSCIQFFVVSVLSVVPAFVLEKPAMASVLAAWLPIVYVGVFSCGIANTLQIIGQKGMNPTVASLILGLESCISVLAGWVLLGQSLTAREGIGCVVMLAAIVLAQLPQKPKPEKQQA